MSPQELAELQRLTELSATFGATLAFPSVSPRGTVLLSTSPRDSTRQSATSPNSVTWADQTLATESSAVTPPPVTSPTPATALSPTSAVIAEVEDEYAGRMSPSNVAVMTATTPKWWESTDTWLGYGPKKET